MLSTDRLWVRVGLELGLDTFFLLLSLSEGAERHKRHIVDGPIDEALGDNEFGLARAHLAGHDGGLASVCRSDKGLDTANLVLAAFEFEPAIFVGGDGVEKIVG
ncbi:hypothetical protein PFISCL1PPCAC_17459, partial [Pristionchus fissidentatus]